MYDDIADIPVSVLDRFSAAPVTQDGDCLRWRGHLDRYGYGYMSARTFDRRQHYSVHRIAYLVANKRIAPGLVLDHLCHTRDCVNANHLEAVTNAENVRRGRPLHQPDCKWGHPLSGDNLYHRPNGARGCRTCRLEATRRSQAKRKLAA